MSDRSDTTYLSKSKFLDGLQCPKLLWTWYNRREIIPEPDAAQQHVFDMGHVVGDLAKQLYPGGVEVPLTAGRDALELTVTATRDLLKRRLPIFEASFLEDGRYCRVDILVPMPGPDGDPRSGDVWDLVEVKSSTKVKDVNIHDVAFQYDTLTRAGVDLNRLYVMHIDNAYMRGRTFDVGLFFALEDVTERALALKDYVPKAVDSMFDVLGGPDPDTPIGTRCHKPYACPLVPHCWGVLPEDNVTELYYAGARAFRFLDEGIFTIAQVPEAKLSPQQAVQKRALATGELQIDREAVRDWLAGLEYPLYHLDFETMNPAIPEITGTRPYQRIPFQYSLHVQDAPGAEPRHHEFLADFAEEPLPGDPRPALVDSLLAAIGDRGTVLAWNMAFERSVLEDLGEVTPTRAHALAALAERLDDLMIPFRSFWVHHPAQKGSCSLKAVLPALTSLTYDNLEIADGNAAGREYARVLYEHMEVEDRDGILQALRDYCRLDTLAMVEILGRLEGLAEG